MGSNNTTRRVVVENEDGASVVKISEEAAAQLNSSMNANQTATIDDLKIEDNDLKIEDSKFDDISPTADSVIATNPKARELEDYYLNKLQQLEERHSRLFDSTKKQFTDTVEEVEKKFLKYCGSPVCQDLQDKVLQCYRANPKQTLLCSELVSAFSTCVENSRKDSTMFQKDRPLGAH